METINIFREMLEVGMISKEEYAEVVCEYRNHVRALMEMDLVARKSKETIDKIKKYEESKKEESDPKMEKLCDAYLNGHISEDDFRRMSNKRKSKLNELSTYGATTSEYVDYMTGILKRNK